MKVKFVTKGLRTIKKHLILVFFICSIIILAWQINGLFGRDAGAHIAMANGITKGKLPYRDYFDVKMPGIAFIYAAIISLAGKSALLLRAFAAAINILIAVLIVKITKPSYGIKTGLVAASLYLLSAAIWGGVDIMTEPFVALCGLAAFAVFLKKDNPQSFFVIGLLLGVATVFKQVGVFYFFAFSILAIMDRNIKKIMTLGAGFALPLLVLLIFYMHEHAVIYLYECIITSFIHRENISLTQFLINAAIVFFALPILWLSPFLKRLIGEKKFGVPLILIVGLSLIPCLTRCYGHYFLTITPFLAIPAADVLMKNKKMLLMLIPTIILVGNSSVQAYTSYHHQTEIGKEIESLVGNDYITVLGAEPIYYFMSDKEPVDDNLFYLWSNDYRYNESIIIDTIEKNNVSLIVIPYEFGEISGVQQNDLKNVTAYCEKHFKKWAEFDFSKYQVQLWIKTTALS